MCSHDDVDYIPPYRGMTEAEVCFYIMPSLIHEQGVILNMEEEDKLDNCGTCGYYVNGDTRQA